MLALLQKEIAGFFSSLTGYVAIVVFLLVSGLFLWVFPGNLNIPDSGMASMAPLFDIAPWIFLFLVPAITMRSIAEEKKAGTMDLLLTRPLTILQIVLMKYAAAVVLILLSLLPVLVYYLSVAALGDPRGNIDHGAFWGSFIGLLLLASCYASIGILASALTENTIVAFLLAVFLSFILYAGFGYLAMLFPLGGAGSLIQSLGIDAHYQSISRGVIDSRDILYFFSVIAVFILIADTKLTYQYR